MSFQVALAGQSIASANIGINTIISATNGSVGNMSITNATIGSLKTTVFEPNSITTNTINSVNAIFDTLVVNNSITELNVVQLNVSQKNVSNLSAINISAEEITCNNLQPLLVAGTNVSILNNVISATNDALLPANANFSSVTSDIVSVLFLDAENMSVDNLSIDQKLKVAGDVNISGILTASNLSTGSLKFGAGLLYDPFDTQLEVDVNHFIQENSNLPVTSWAVYKAINNQYSNIQTQWAYTLSESEFISVVNSIGPGQENTICYLDIYPNYENSKIVVEFSYSYTVAGFGSDSIVTYIRIGRNNNTSNTTIQEIFQQWTDEDGGGTRSGTAGTIKGVYTNTDTVGKFNRIYLRVDNNSDDNWSLDNPAFVTIHVTEFVEIAGISNPNIKLGNGNISCGNISCSSLSITDFTIDNVITNYNVNVGGDMITVGFPMSGAYASKSIVRLAGGGVLLNSGDLTWDGTTFNVSTRQANKNFKVSFGQQDYFEVNTNNTSCRSLYVNGNISMSGTLTIGGSLIFANAIIENSLLVNGLITASDAEFSGDVTFDDNVSMHKRLNVSNLSVTQGLTVYGNISTRGNISANSIYAPNLSTASLKAGTNITIVDGFINAYVEGGTLVDCGSLLVDNDANIFGILNVSETSTFSESLNVCNILYTGKSGQHDGSVVLYSQSVGNNWATKYDGSVLNMSATGGSTGVNIWLGADKILSITPNGVNICGTLKADAIDADYENFSTVNLSVSNDLTVTNRTILNNVSVTNLSVSQTTSSILTATQVNGINGHFSSSLTAANISTGSLIFGSGLNYFLGVLSVDFTTAEVAVAELDQALAANVSTDDLVASLGTIDVLTVQTFMNTPEVNVSVVNCSDVDANTGTIDVLDCTNFSATNISNTNITSTKLTATNISNTNCSISTKLTVPNISSVRANFTTDIITPKVTTEALNTSTFMMFNILNAPSMELSDSLYLYTDIRGTNMYLTENICVVNSSFNNLSCTTGTITTLRSTTQNTTTTNTSTLNASSINTVSFSVQNNFNAGQINFGLLVGPTINASTINSSTSTAVNVNGLAVNGSSIKGNNISVLGTGTLDSFLIRSTTTNANTLNCSNINVSTKLTVTNISNTNCSISTKLTVPNISSVRANFTTDIITPKVTTEALNTSTFMMFNILNAPSMELSDSLYLYTDIRGTNMYLTENTCGNNGSFTNISATSLTATSIVAPNVQQTLIEGSGISIVGNTISSTGTTYTAGQNIQIVGEVISTLSTINVSNISTDKLDVNTSVNARFLNSSSLKTLELNVSGFTTLDNLTVSGVGATAFVVDEVSVGKPAGTGSRSVVTFWSPSDANHVGLQIGLNDDRFARISVPFYDSLTLPRFNINLSNVSYLTMSNNSTRFQQNVIFGSDVTATKITSTNICNTNLTATKITSTNICNTNLSTTNCTITTLRGTTLNGTTINASNLNISTKLSVTNISGTNASFTSLTASNVQPTLIAGTNISIVGNTISATGGTNLTAGNNLQIVGDVISTLPSINVSNISAINGSFTNLTSSNISFPIGDLLYRSPFDGILNVSELNISNTLLGPLATSFKSSLINTTKLNASNISLVAGLGGGILDMGGLGQITKLGILTGMTLNASQTNSSNISSINGTFTNISATNISTSRIDATDRMVINNSAPTLYLKDTDARSGIIRMNLGRMYFLSGETNSETFSQVNNEWPLILYTDTNEAVFGGGITLNTGNLSLLSSTGKITAINGSFTNLTSTQLTSTNISTTNLSATALSLTGDLNVNGFINRKNNIIRRYRTGDQSLLAPTYQVIYGAVQFSNANLVIPNATNDIFTIVKAGRYRISTNVLFSNGTYTDRVNWRVQLYKNDATDTSLGTAHCYTRHRDYARFGSAFHTSIQDFDVDDTFFYLVTCSKGVSTDFTSAMGLLLVLNNTCLEIEYLGE